MQAPQIQSNVSLTRKQIYLANPNLKKIGVPVAMSEEQLNEYLKCKNDPVYFIENYVEINTIDKGYVKLKLYEGGKNERCGGSILLFILSFLGHGRG